MAISLVAAPAVGVCFSRRQSLKGNSLKFVTKKLIDRRQKAVCMKSKTINAKMHDFPDTNFQYMENRKGVFSIVLLT